MPRKKDVVFDPYLIEYIFDTIRSCKDEGRIRLKGKFEKAFRDSKNAKKFAVDSNYEDKAILLSKMGIQWAWVFNLSKQKLNEIYKDANGLTGSELSNKMLTDKMFVITDKQVFQFLGLMASNCHSETWLLNRDFHIAGYQLSRWRKVNSSPTVNAMKENIATSKAMSKIFLNCLLASNYTEGMFGINEVGLMILCYLHSKEKEFVPKEDVIEYFGGIYKTTLMTNTINRLLESQFMEQTANAKDRKYKITGLGVDVCMKYQKKVYNLENY